MTFRADMWPWGGGPEEPLIARPMDPCGKLGCLVDSGLRTLQSYGPVSPVYC